MRHPEFHMESRMLLDKIDFQKKTVCVDGKTYPMKDVDFPTLDPEHPYELTEEESKVMLRLQQVFMRCEKLQRHVKFLYSKGGMYKIYNGNLLYHGLCASESGRKLQTGGNLRKRIFRESAV